MVFFTFFNLSLNFAIRSSLGLSSAKAFLSTVVDTVVIWIKCLFPSILVHWYLKCWCSLLLPLLGHVQFTLIHGPKIPGSDAVFFTSSDFIFTPGICTTVCHFHLAHPLFFLELFLCYLPVAYWALSDLGGLSPGVISFLPFHTVRGVFKARILKWFVIPSSSGSRFFRTLHGDLFILGGPAQHGS